MNLSEAALLIEDVSEVDDCRARDALHLDVHTVLRGSKSIAERNPFAM